MRDILIVITRFLTTVSFFLSFSLTSSFANEEILKSAEILFEAKITDTYQQWGRDEGDGYLDTNLAFTGLQVALLNYKSMDDKPIDTELSEYLNSNKQNLDLFFEYRVTSDQTIYQALKKHRKLFGKGVKGEVLASGKINLKKVRKSVPVGSTGVEEKVMFLPEIDMYTTKESQEFRIEGSWSVVAEKRLKLSYTATLNKAYHGRRHYASTMWNIPDYVPCFHTLAIDLKSWGNTSDKDFEDWLQKNSNALKIKINKVWRNTEFYNELALYQNAWRQFTGEVQVSGTLSLTHVTLKNGDTKVISYASVESVAGPKSVVDTQSQKIRVLAKLNKINKSFRDLFDEDTNDVGVELQVKGYAKETKEDEIHPEFKEFIVKQLFSSNHRCTLENSYDNSSILTIRVHKAGAFNTEVRGNVMVLFDLSFTKNTFADGSAEIGYRYELEAVKGPLGSHKQSEFDDLSDMVESKKGAIFEAFYQ